MVTVADGVAWLLALAARYEESARQLRQAAARVQENEETLATLPASRPPSPQDGTLSISEAIRQVLLDAARPLRQKEIADRLEQNRDLRTKSGNVAKLVPPTLTRMKRGKFVRQRDGGWELTA